MTDWNFLTVADLMCVLSALIMHDCLELFPALVPPPTVFTGGQDVETANLEVRATLRMLVNRSPALGLCHYL